MILIKNIEYEIVPGTIREVLHQCQDDVVEFGDYKRRDRIKEEIVNGTIFRRPDGQELVVGVVGEAAEVLGVCYEVYENQVRELENATESINRLTFESAVLVKGIETRDEQLEFVALMGFWKRLKFLLTGRLASA